MAWFLLFVYDKIVLCYNHIRDKGGTYMPYKIIFVDIDWTLYNHKTKSFVESGLKAIEKAKANGLKIILASGRSFHSMKEIGAIDAVPYDGYIGNNGGCAVYNNKVISISKLDKDELVKMIDLCKQNNITLELIEPMRSFLIGNQTESMFHLYKDYFAAIPPSEGYHGQDVIQALMFADFVNGEKIIPYCNFIFRRFHPDGVDVYQEDVSKGETIKHYLDYLGISPSEAIAFGDGLNDIEMFETVGLAIAVGNACDEAKQVAKFITKNIEDDGIEFALKKFNVI